MNKEVCGTRRKRDEPRHCLECHDRAQDDSVKLVPCQYVKCRTLINIICNCNTRVSLRVL